MLNPYIEAIELRDLVRKKELRPREVAEFFLARIEQLNSRLGAFMTVTPEVALADAERLEKMTSEQINRCSLYGVPYAVKDLSWTRGIRTTMGSKNYENFVPDQDAEFVVRLRNAGAIMLGKTTTPEFGGRGTTEGGLCPPARNPWNLEHSAGGSSGGAGAALASGLLPIAQGSDGGGSIRIPSSCCGVVGLKTSRGRITNAPQKLEEWAGCAVLGPMARTVRDAALMLDVMAGPTIGEPHWAPNPPAAFRSAAQIPPMKLRIAMIAKSALSSGDRETEAALDAAAKTFESLGHRVEPIDLDPAAMLVGTFMVIVCGATAAEKVPNPQLMDPVVRASREVGLGMTAAQYVEAVHQMHELSRQLLLRLAPYDVLITPTLARPAPRIGSLPSAPERMQQEFGDWAPFAFPWNMTGQPAFSLPNGFNRAGLPIGLQLVGRPADEVTLIQLAAQFEKERPWNFRDQHPQLN